MKKLVSIMLAVVMLISACIMNVSAIDTDATESTSVLEQEVMSEVENAFDKLFEEVNNTNRYDTTYLQIWDYYCHFVDEYTIDYVYVSWHNNSGADAVVGQRYLDYCIKTSCILNPTIGLYIYDVANKTVYTFDEAQMYAEEYLRDLLDNHSDKIANKYSHYSVYKCGDANLDGEITVLDATAIQLALAGVEPFSYRDTVYSYHSGAKTYYISDFDFDGERTVLDATAIQLKLAKLE